MKKTYADECLERAEKATEGPWTATSDWEAWAVASLNAHTDVVGTLSRAYRIPSRKHLGCELRDADFIANARTDVPELARRLKRAIDLLYGGSCELECKYEGLHPSCGFHKELAELEAPPEGER